MGTAVIVCTCLALTAHQAPPQEYFMSARELGIPVHIDDQRKNDVMELTLLVSQDQGATWTQVERKTTDLDRQFVFRAAKDGRYWFIVQEKDRRGRLNPADPGRVRPGMAIVVDTLKPKVTVTAERQANGQVQASWQIVEDYPEPRTLRLYYHTDAMPPQQWTPLLPASPSLQGSHEFNPGSAGEVRVRVQMQDRAGNVGQGETVVAASAAAAAPAQAGHGGPYDVIPTAREQSGAPGLLAGRTSSHADLAPPGPPPLPSAPAPDHRAVPPPDEFSCGRPPVGAPLASTSDRPPVKLVNKREVRLDFEVAKVGPSGLGGADVYVTVNEGAGWTKVGELPLLLPPGGELPGHGPVRGSVAVQLPAEGTVYGFIVAVKSKAGLARPAPKPNEPPQARIELDATAPKAQLFGPLPDANQSNALVLSWGATDRNLPADAVRIEWAERKDGPWNVIADGVANASTTGPLPQEVTGSYVWRLPERVPSRVYLRLTVRDAAGNAARAEADKPVLIDLSVPETNIIGVAPGGR